MNATLEAAIDCYMGPHRFLSNFHLKSVFWRGIWFNSNEHGYNFTKGIGVEPPHNLVRFHSPLEIAGGKILPVYTSTEAKREGRKIALREDWELIKYAVMLLLNIEKFSTNPERQMLLNTGNATLREGNWWHDNIWGDCIFGSREDAMLYLSGKPFNPCLKCANIKGQNLLGKIHTRIRSDIQFDEQYKALNL